MVDLSVKVAGVEFRNPILAASGTPTKDFKRVKRAVEAGAGGVVVKGVVSESLSYARRWPRPRFKLLKSGLGRLSSSFSLYSIEQAHPLPPDGYAKMIREMRGLGVPVIPNIMAASVEEWAMLAELMEGAGAEIIEANPSCPHMALERRGPLYEDYCVEVMRALREAVSVPVFVKMTPQLTDPVSLAVALEEAGADGLTMFNRFTGLEIDVFREEPILHGSYAGFGGSWIIPFGLRWVSAIYPRVKIPISAVGGITGWEDAVKYILVGATTTQLCTAIIVNGYEAITEVVGGLKEYMEGRGYTSISELRGKALKKLLPIDKVKREEPLAASVDERLCNGCGVCIERCPYEAIQNKNGLAFTDRLRCDGCGLCVELCPTKAINMTAL